MTNIEQLRNALARYQSAKQTQKQPFRASAEATALWLADDRNELVKRMEKRWAWLDANAGHPQFAEREDALLADLATYEQTEDVLREAADVLYGSAA